MTRKELNRAIEEWEPAAATGDFYHLRCIIDAAKAHLETLPKPAPKKRVLAADVHYFTPHNGWGTWKCEQAVDVQANLPVRLQLAFDARCEHISVGNFRYIEVDA